MKIFEDKNGQRMCYHDLEGASVPILFIHGLGCASSSDYPEVAGSTFLTKHRRILVDLLGYGFSDKRDSVDFSLVNQADALANLIDHLEIESLVIFGHSMGGAVAIHLANKIRNKVHSLVLSEANLDSGGGSFSLKILGYSLQDYISVGHIAIVEERRRQGSYAWPASMEVSKPAAVHRGAQDLVSGVTPSWRAMLYSFDFPRTYIFGEKNLPDKDEEELKKNGIKIGIVSAAGHNMANENADGLAEEIGKGIGT